MHTRIRPGLDGLVIERTPDTWPEYSIKRTVNGAEMEVNKIPYEKEKVAVNVLAIVGRERVARLRPFPFVLLYPHT